MSKASTEKGARGEREWRDKLRAAGFAAERRGHLQRYHRHDLFAAPDVHSADLDGLWFEVKNHKSPSLGAWWGQAQRDCGDRRPVVIWKKPGGQWLAVITADHLLELLTLTRRDDS